MLDELANKRATRLVIRTTAGSPHRFPPWVSSVHRPGCGPTCSQTQAWNGHPEVDLNDSIGPRSVTAQGALSRQLRPGLAAYPQHPCDVGPDNVAAPVVTADETGVVRHAGTVLLGELADRIGLTAALSEATDGLRQRRAGHDPAASSVRLPSTIKRQNSRPTCLAGIGRPGERIACRSARSVCC